MKYPDQDIYAGSQFEETTTKYLRISISELGSATAGDNENRLQIMEMEALDAAGINLSPDPDVNISTT